MVVSDEKIKSLREKLDALYEECEALGLAFFARVELEYDEENVRLLASWIIEGTKRVPTRDLLAMILLQSNGQRVMTNLGRETVIGWQRQLEEKRGLPNNVVKFPG